MARSKLAVWSFSLALAGWFVFFLIVTDLFGLVSFLFSIYPRYFDYLPHFIFILVFSSFLIGIYHFKYLDEKKGINLIIAAVVLDVIMILAFILVVSSSFQ